MSSSNDDLEIPTGDAETPPPKGVKSKRAMSTHPKYNDMLIEALKSLDEKKGASVVAIKHWIIETYPEVDQSRMKNLLRMAIKRGVESGSIVRPKKSEGMGAALTGRFKLGKPPKPAKKAEKKKAEKKKKVAAGKKKAAKSPKKKDRKQSDHDIFDYEDDTEGSDPDGGKTPPPYRKNRAKKQPVEKENSKKAAKSRPRSASANATPKPRLINKSRALVRRSKSQSPAPSKLKKARKPVSKSPVKKAKSKSPAKKPKSKAATSKTSPAATGKAKAKKPVAKNKDKTPTKKAAKTTKKKITK